MNIKAALLTICCFLTINIAFADGIQITAPASPNIITSMSTVPITWDAQGNFSTVKIEFVNMVFNGVSKSYLVTNSTENDGSFDWEVPMQVEQGTALMLKITAVEAPTVFGVSAPIPTQSCPITAFFSIAEDICPGNPIPVANNSENATSFRWIFNGRRVGQTRDLNFTPESISPFHLILEASNGNCTKRASLQLPATSIMAEPCKQGGDSLEVIQEMVLGGTDDYLPSEVSIRLMDTLRVLSFTITHQAEDIRNWDWTQPTLSNFSDQNIDLSKAKDGLVKVTWTSPDPTGTLLSGDLYTLKISHPANQEAPVRRRTTDSPQARPVGAKTAKIRLAGFDSGSASGELNTPNGKIFLEQ